MDPEIAKIIQAATNAFGNPKAEAEARQYQQNREINEFRLGREKIKAGWEDEDRPNVKEANRITVDAAKRKEAANLKLGEILSGFFVHDKERGIGMTPEGRARVSEYIQLMRETEGHDGVQKAYDFLNRAGIPLEGTATLTPEAAAIARTGGIGAGYNAAHTMPGVVGLTPQNISRGLENVRRNALIDSAFGTQNLPKPGEQVAGHLSPLAQSLSLQGKGLSQQKIDELTKALAVRIGASDSGAKGDIGAQGDAGAPGDQLEGTESPASPPSPDPEPPEPGYVGLDTRPYVTSFEDFLARRAATQKKPPIVEVNPETGHVTSKAQDISIDESQKDLKTFSEALRGEYAKNASRREAGKVGERNMNWVANEGRKMILDSLSIDSADTANTLPSPIASMLADYAGRLKKDLELLHNMPPDEAASMAVKKVAEAYRGQGYSMDPESWGSPKVTKAGKKTLWWDTAQDTKSVIEDKALKDKLDTIASVYPELILGPNNTASPTQEKSIKYVSSFVNEHGIAPGSTQMKIIENDPQIMSLIAKMKHYEAVVLSGQEVRPNPVTHAREIHTVTPENIKQMQSEIVRINALLKSKIGY